MAKVKLRPSYGQDAAFLVRLQEAIERDRSKPIKWRKEVNTCLEKLIALFVQVTKEEGGDK